VSVPSHFSLLPTAYSPLPIPLPANIQQSQPAQLPVHGAGDILAFAANVAQLAVGEIHDVLLDEFLLCVVYRDPGVTTPVEHGAKPGRRGYG
jgi:hypothetical protein